MERQHPLKDTFDWMVKLDCLTDCDVDVINENRMDEGFFDKVKGWFKKDDKKDEDEGLTYYPLSWASPDAFSCSALKLKGNYRSKNAYAFFYYAESQTGWIGRPGKCHIESIGDMLKRQDAIQWLEKLIAKKGLNISTRKMWERMRSRRDEPELVDGRIWLFDTPVMFSWKQKKPQWILDAAGKLSNAMKFDIKNLLIGYGKRLYPYDSFVKKVHKGIDTNNAEYSEDAENLEKMKQAHLMNGEEKAKIYEPYLRDKYRNMGANLTNDKGEEMTRAEYNALRRPFSESKELNEDIYDCPDHFEWNNRTYRHWEGSYPFFFDKDTKQVMFCDTETHVEYMSDWAEMKLSELYGDKFYDRPDYRELMSKQIDKFFENRNLGSGRLYPQVPAILYWQTYNPEEAKKWALIIAKAAETDPDIQEFDTSSLIIHCNKQLVPITSIENADVASDEEQQSYQNTLDNEKAIHLMNQSDKRDVMGQYLKDRSQRQSDKLVNTDTGKEMSRAEYNALKRPYSESKGLFGGILEKVCKN